MKITVIILTLLFAVSIGAAQDVKAPEAPAAATSLAVSTISVPGVQCSMCVKNISKALSALEGVAETDVDLDEKTTTVKYDPKKTDLKELEKAIANAGYDANDTKRDPKAYDKLSPCCKIDG